ncbi:phosphoribosylaminoimidazole carboxylase putative / AIR carboxylase putative [Euphorbia peplus]|nr:phosphoribosylaminoimidazole carboxylase putative / AIR carboxylase putative [Euphorbia peplus]
MLVQHNSLNLVLPALHCTTSSVSTHCYLLPLSSTKTVKRFISIYHPQLNHSQPRINDTLSDSAHPPSHGISDKIIGVLGGGQLARNWPLKNWNFLLQFFLGGFDRGLYVEKWAPFIKELAVIVARGRDNSILCYPVVETIHKENICHIVKAPADVPCNVKKLATDVAYKAIESLEGAGVFAVELFLTNDGQILLNEVAPRPHNSGHHTIESCYTSQYEQHLRAVVGLPLGDPSMKTPAAIMYNILGEDEGEAGFRLAHKLIARALDIPGASVHWYEKSEMRKQRKMGHITIVGPSLGIVEARLNSILNEEGSDNLSAVAPRVGIIMGSDSDLPVMKDAARILDMFGVPHEVRIVSAHRTPEMMFSYASSARQRGVQIIIAGAGGAAHLPGMVASLTPLPVIGVPVRGSSLDGMDSLLSIVQMPRGVPVATVAINNATNAGLLAIRILGVGDPDLLARMGQYQEETRDEVIKKAEKLESDGCESYLNP